MFSFQVQWLCCTLVLGSLRLQWDFRVLFLIPAWAAVSVQLQIISSEGLLANSDTGSNGRVWLFSSSNKLGQDQDKSLEKNRNALWKKQMWFFIKKNIFSWGLIF